MYSFISSYIPTQRIKKLQKTKASWYLRLRQQKRRNRRKRRTSYILYGSIAKIGNAHYK